MHSLRQLNSRATGSRAWALLQHLAATKTEGDVFSLLPTAANAHPQRHLGSIHRPWAPDAVAGTTIKPLRSPEQQQQLQQQKIRPEQGQMNPGSPSKPLQEASGFPPRAAGQQADNGKESPARIWASHGESPIMIRQIVNGRVHETVLHGTPSGTVRKEIHKTEDTTLAAEVVPRNVTLAAGLSDQLKATFLPTGYPKTVAPNYLNYVVWRALQQASSSANGVLASSFLLYSIGLGQGAIPVAGAVNWVLKDGIGQAGTLLCARFMAQSFDDNARGWYVRGAILNNFASMVEISTVFMPEYFLVMGAFANALKGLTWMSLGATSAAFNLAFQRKNNIADIHARTTTQSITVGLIGTGAGAWAASIVGQSPIDALMVSTALCMANIFSAYRTTKCVPLQTLNPVRCRILAGKFADQTPDGNLWVPTGSSKCLLPDPATVAGMDPVAFLPQRLSRLFQSVSDPQGKSWPPRIGTPLHEASKLQPDLLKMIVKLHARSQFMVFPMDGDMHVILRDSAKDFDFIEAFLHAEMLLREIAARKRQRTEAEGGGGASGGGGGAAVCSSGFGDLELPASELEEALVASLHLTATLGPLFRHELQRAGWCTQRLVIEGKLNRATW